MLKDYLSKFIALALCLFASNLVVAQSSFTVNGPGGEVTYATAATTFSATDFSAAGDVAFVDDGTLGCDPITTDVSGKIALIDRGACAFATKAENAEAAGAIGAVICLSAAGNPFPMIGTNPAVNIPVVCLDSTNCAAIKMELAAGAVTGSFTAPLEGETVITAIEVGEGTHTTPEITAGFGGALFGGGTHGSWYKYTTSGDNVLTITTCPHDAENTRLIVIPGVDGAAVSQALIDGVFLFSQGACANGLGSDLQFIVGPGETYYFQWDDSGGNSGGFDFDINETAIPDINVTFTVDMQDETVDPEGVLIAGTFTGWDQTPMTDNGDGTWSYTVMGAPAGSEHQWKYLNGTDGFEDSAELEACGVDDGFGGFNRFAVLNSLEDIVLPTVCFTSCLGCPPDVACPNWIQDDFESYTLGGISDQSPNWTTWTPGSASEDADVIDAGSVSGVQALQISADDPDDLLLLLGDRTSGNFILKWKMYVPAGSGGYYNLQKEQGSPGAEFANEVIFNPDGTGDYFIGGGSFPFEYPQDTWFEVFHNVDLDNNLNRVWINGAGVVEHPANWQAGSEDGQLQLGGVDFFGLASSSTLYWVDDVLLKEVEPCPADAIICDGLDGYDLGDLALQSPWWNTWDLTPGGAMDVDVTNAQQNSCEQSVFIGDDTVQDPILLLGNRTEGNYYYSMDMYIPAGKVSYWNVQESETPAVAWNLNMHFGNDTGGNTATPGEGVVAETGTVFTYPEDQWFTVEATFDLDNNSMDLWVDGVQVETGYNYTANLGAINIYSINADNQVYLDNVIFRQLPSLVGNICDGAIDLNPYTGGGVGTTVSTPLYNNTGLSTEASDPMTGWECFGEPDGGGAAPELNNTQWFTFEGDGETYYIETGECDATDYIDDGDTQMAIYSGSDCGDLTPVACNEDSPNATSGNFISGLELATEAGVTYYMLIDGFSFNGAVSDGEYCINFTQLTGTETVEVTFGVDLTGYLAAGGTLETVKIAGNFADNGAIGVPNWEPTASPVFTDQGMDVWTTTIEFDVASAGGNLEFKFLNTADTWGDCGIQQECMEDGADDECKNPDNDNRLFVIPSENAELCFTWETCVGCNEAVSTREQLVDIPMTIAPNPFSQEAIVTFGTPLVDADAKLTTLTGQVARTFVVTGTQLIIEKENLNPGVYFFTVTTDEGVSTAQKLIVQ